MADPLSVTAGILAIVQVVLQGALQTKQFINGIQGAPRVVQSLSKDLDALYVVLGVLRGHLDYAESNATFANLIPMLSAPLENCLSAFKNILKTIKPFVKISGEAKEGQWRRFKWTLFREKDVGVLQNVLNTCKMSLDVAVSVANMSSSTTEFQTLKREIRVLRKRLHDDRASLITTDSLDSDSSGGDYGYALRKFLLGTENVIAGVDSGAIDAEVDAGTTTLTSQSTMVDDRPFGLPEPAAQFDSALAQFEFPFQEKSAEEEVRSSPVTTSRAALHTDITSKDSRVQWTTIAPASYAPSLEIFKTFRVGLEDPCYKVLPAALRKFNIDADCRRYALYIVCGDQEICVALDEKPLAMFKDLDQAGKDPRFMLRRLHDSVNKLEHPAPQEPTSAFMASYDAVEFHHPFQTSILARRPHLSLTTTTTEAPDNMERAHSVTPSLENRKDSRQSSGTEIDTSSPLSSLTSPHQELLESEAPIQAEREVDNGQISNQPPPQRHGCHPGSQDGHITPEESPSIIAIEQLLPRPHKCSKGENCPKWRKQQRKMRILHEEFQAAPNHPTDPVRFDPSPPSVIASSDLLGPSQLPQFAITPEALSCIEIRDPQANVVQFLGLQHLIEMPHLPDDDPRFKKWI